MASQAEKCLAPDGLYVQVEALGPASGSPFHAKAIREPSGEKAGEVASSGQRREWNGRQSLLLLRPLLPTPSVANDGRKDNDQDGENACGDPQPL